MLLESSSFPFAEPLGLAGLTFPESFEVGVEGDCLLGGRGLGDDVFLSPRMEMSLLVVLFTEA